LQLDKTNYNNFIKDIKSKIQTSQIKASIKVNIELLKLYWNLAQMIVEKQKETSWGDNLILTISNDLKKEFPNLKGFSKTNLLYMKKWYLFFTNIPQVVGKNENIKGQQLVALLENNIFHIPWGHNREIITKCKNIEEAQFYINKTIENNWSRSVLVHQIKSNLYNRQAEAITNFKDKLPDVHSNLALETLKDPYNFDFLMLSKKHDEKELEDALVDNMTHFLLELGQGFSFVGRQYKLEIEGDTFKIDLLFYNIKLHCYVVVELKTAKFKPEFAGKLNFYVSAVDGEIKGKLDNPTIGILICKSKNNTVVEYALKDMSKPLGISEYQLTQILPDEFKSSLPSIEDIEKELE
jgi:predicted nuclease of restriction endonuclease-like (RecB) superfamily